MHQLGAVVVAVLLLGGVFVAEAQRASPTPNSCEGLDAYRQAYAEAIREYSEADQRIRPIMLGGQIRFRDPMTISTAEWSELAESAEASQSALSTIQPPPWLADFHQMQIERMGLESAFAREVLKNGITVAEPAFADARSALRGDTEEAIQRAGDICVDFARLVELSAPDADGKQHYTVREGDTLSGVAARFGVSLESILAANQTADAGGPVVGQEIVIPLPTAAGTPVPLATPASNRRAAEQILPAAEATLSAFVAQQAANDQRLEELAREAAQVGVRATEAASSAQATIDALTTREAAQATKAANVAATATANAARGPNAVATVQAEAAANELATAQAEAAARGTEVAALQAQQVNAQVTATALAVVAANSVLDPNRQTITIETDLDGMLANDEDSLEDARNELDTQLSRYPVGCRAGFMLIAGKAPEIEEGVKLARRVEDLLQDVRPDVFTESTGAELFALPNTRPFGEALIDIFFYSGCEPIG